MQRPWASYLAVDQRGRVTAQPLPTPQALRSLEQQGRVHNLGGGWVMPVSDWDVASAKPHQGDGKCTHAAATPPARGCTDATQQAGTGSLDLFCHPSSQASGGHDVWKALRQHALPATGTDSTVVVYSVDASANKRDHTQHSVMRPMCTTLLPKDNCFPPQCIR